MASRSRHLPHQALNHPGITRLRRGIFHRKAALKEVYLRWYRRIRRHIPQNVPGRVLELGSGPGFLSEHIPGLITSEILEISGVDVILDAHDLPFADRTLRCIVMIDVLHHLHRVTRFLDEAARCVAPRGRIVMLEPWVTPWSRFIYTWLHHEPFDPDTLSWHFTSSGPLSDANSALPWILFHRDREAFSARFPFWRIDTVDPMTPFSYLLAGGMSYPALLPSRALHHIARLENAYASRLRCWAMFSLIVLSRR